MMISKLRRRMNFVSEEDGFTLIELMIVIAVLGVLAGIAIPKFTGVQDKAEDTNITSTAGTIRSAMEMYFAENNGYPDTDDIKSYSDLQTTLDDYVDLPDLNDSQGDNLVDSFAYNSQEEDATNDTPAAYLVEIQSSATENTYYIGEKNLDDTSETSAPSNTTASDLSPTIPSN